MPTMRTLLRRDNENGQVVVLLAVTLVVLIGSAALVIVRGGELRSRFAGVADRLTVAQAVTNALK